MVGSCVTDEIVQALCEAGARVDAEDSRGRTALQRAQDNKQEAAVSELRHRGA
jgi:ankyrin repeat protein